MLEELTTETGAGAWATASLLFFIVVYLIVSIRTYRTPTSEHDAHARLALHDEEDGRS